MSDSIPVQHVDDEGRLHLNIMDDVHWEFARSSKRQRILECVRELGEASIATLAKHLGVSAQHVQYHIDWLVSAGFATRLLGKSDSGRRPASVYASIMPRGQVVLHVDSTDPAAKDRLDQSMRSWTRVMRDSFEESYRIRREQQCDDHLALIYRWVSVTPQQRARIESLYEQLGDAIAESDEVRDLEGQELVRMQFALSYIGDYASRGPLPNMSIDVQQPADDPAT